MQQHVHHKKVNRTKINKDITAKQINHSKIIWICSNKEISHITFLKKQIVVKMKLMNKMEKKLSEETRIIN